MSNDNNSASGGIGFFGLLAIVFITLRLLGQISWPWVWVLSPIWIPVAVAVVILLAVVVAGLIRASRDNAKNQP